MRKIAFVVCLASVGGVSEAQETCTKISAPIARLTCYDQWAGKELGAIIISESLPPGVAAAEAAKVATPDVEADPAPLDKPKTGKWTLEVVKSKMKDTNDAFADLMSQEAVQCASFGDTSALQLTLRCMENTTAITVGGNCHLASGFQGYGKVTYRIGDREAQSKNFQASTDNQVLGLWSGNTAIPMIKEMLGEKKMLVRFTPFSMSPVEAEFDITGIDEAVTNIRKSCNW